MKKRNTILLLTLWAALALGSWLLPAKELSEAERRPLAQAPEISADSILSGAFMADFEEYALDQFPLRDSFRTIKSLVHTRLLGQKDNNGIYIADGYAVKQEYPLNEASLDHAVERFTKLYERYLKDSPVYMAIVPDKGYYLADSAGQLKLDHDRLCQRFRQELPWAEFIDLTDLLSEQSYYRTDTHWRQECLIPVAERICAAMETAGPGAYTATALERPFYGVYYGQAALPMEPDVLTLLENETLEGCTVYDYESGKTGAVYDLAKLESRDLYDVFLSGARPLLTIDNPKGEPGRELLVFRDSFGSSLVPLLVEGYSRVTLIDIRYIRMELLEQFVEFHGQDVLLLYSTLVLNNSETIK